MREGMIAALRQEKSTRGCPRRATAGRGGLNIPGAIEIKYRSEEIAQRRLPGHWEGDFIKGAFNRSAVGTLVERKTRLKKLPAFLRESLTYDRGSASAKKTRMDCCGSSCRKARIYPEYHRPC